VHNSAARSEAAANALKSELVLRPLALPPPPPLSAYPTRRGINSPLLLPPADPLVVSRLHLPFASCVAVPWSLGAVERFFGLSIRGFLVWCDETKGEGRD